ncbi:hypothetical protein NY2A_B130R [Paramecium bursaria Chlorella virus NY2A]|uniref:Uncharacterized protein B130R n=1 Tax=Paramecium bursaria Chlorella virus NY2A TaxID=46021 RepID=A7IW05_PBCVN|nr:hypothetical protein NY2A_B130R [Paramecium bursaria Chlorella virus NY2A]ABT14529.1 hypothetical protein NY2A_B130R [Paramecium bursaria Chlorella virus NY2A]
MLGSIWKFVFGISFISSAFARPCSVSEPSYAPIPAPSSPENKHVIIENNCTNDIIVGNMYRTDDKTQSYDIRCAPYSTLAYGESMYLDIPASDEHGYFSAYDIVQQKNTDVFFTLGNYTYGSYLGFMVDVNKEHLECDNQLRGNDLWYAYTIPNDYIIVNC